MAQGSLHASPRLTAYWHRGALPALAQGSASRYGLSVQRSAPCPGTGERFPVRSSCPLYWYKCGRQGHSVPLQIPMGWVGPLTSGTRPENVQNPGQARQRLPTNRSAPGRVGPPAANPSKSMQKGGQNCAMGQTRHRAARWRLGAGCGALVRVPAVAFLGSSKAPPSLPPPRWKSRHSLRTMSSRAPSARS